MKRKGFTKIDFLLIALVLVLVLVLYLPSLFARGARVAEVTVSGETVLGLDLQKIDAPQEIALPNGVVLLAEEQSIRFLSADCPNALCLHAGALSKAGDIAVCVPNQTVIYIRGADSQDALDAITY